MQPHAEPPPLQGLRTVEKLASVLKALTFTAIAAAAGLGASAHWHATSALATGGSGGSAAVPAAVAAGVAVVLALLMNAVRGFARGEGFWWTIRQRGL